MIKAGRHLLLRSLTLPVVPLALLAAGGSGAFPSAVQDEEAFFASPEDMPWGPPGGGARFAGLYGDPGTPGQSFTFRLELDGAFEMGPHTHPVAEHVTVLRGTLVVGFGRELDRENVRRVQAGGYVVIPENAPAYMWAEGPAVIQVHGVGPFSTTMIESP